MSGELHVVAGAIIGPDDRVLIAQRPAGRHLAGGWEFPGGKLDPGEGREEGLRRELREEVGIQVRNCRPLIRLRHSYSDRRVLLDVWLVDRYEGEPRSLDGQRLRWCTRNELSAAQLLAADRPVVTALRLPAVIRASTGCCFDLLSFDAFVSRVDGRGQSAQMTGVLCRTPAQALEAAAAGADFIALERGIGPPDLRDCCERAGRPVYASGIALPDAWNLGAAGVVDFARF